LHEECFVVNAKRVGGRARDEDDNDSDDDDDDDVP
jgi:hypothetical protein